MTTLNRGSFAMNVVHDLAGAALVNHETAVTIGAFDGVHLGHQALIRQVVARARATDRLAAVITFYPHPATVLAPDRAPLYLTTPGEKLALFEALDVDVVALLPFTHQLAALSASEFMAAAVGSLRVRELWVGAGFALGRDRGGDLPRLRELGRELGYEVHTVEPERERATGQTIISSSLIRTLLRQGRVEEAAGMLGRSPSVSGKVVVGAGRGHRFGYPTAKLEIRRDRAVPANGVYAAYAVLPSLPSPPAAPRGAQAQASAGTGSPESKAQHAAVAHVGTGLGSDDETRTVETHLLDLEGDFDLQGCSLVVEFVARLRDERRFDDVDDLAHQLERDAQAARQILREPSAASSRQGPACPWRYQEVEHTADRALQVWGLRLTDLFVGAARGMYSLMADLDAAVACQWREIRLEGLDREALLVRWLNELLFLTETEDLLFVDFQIGSLAETSLVARAGGVPAAVTKAHIKAATYHALELFHNGGGWTATITFDV